jgi:hypothetical protein
MMLWRKRDILGVYFLPPFVSLNLAVRNSCISVQIRQGLIQVAFHLFLSTFWHYLATGVSAGISEQKCVSCRRVTLWTKAICTRGCNLCIVLYWVFRTYKESGNLELALGRIGSHLCECHFGMA